jgi:hypothetical protein
MPDRLSVDLQAHRVAVEAEIQQRIVAHQRLLANQGFLANRSPTRPLNLLADGDSWFDYPLSDGFPIPSDVIVQLGTLVSPRPFILNLAHHGDATTQMLGVTKRNRLIAALQDPKNGVFDGILFSGGGNDLVGDQFRLWLNDAEAVGRDPARALNQPALDDIMGVVETAYLDLVATRNLVGDMPILVHAYDFAHPTDIGVCGVGPWLFPSLMSRGWMQNTGPADLAVGDQIVRLILEKFQKLVEKMASVPGNNVVPVATQGTLSSGDWANELHPKPEGFQKIAQKFLGPLGEIFPGRAATQAIIASPQPAAIAPAAARPSTS